jgi:hypothetical protein
MTYKDIADILKIYQKKNLVMNTQLIFKISNTSGRQLWAFAMVQNSDDRFSIP